MDREKLKSFIKESARDRNLRSFNYILHNSLNITENMTINDSTIYKIIMEAARNASETEYGLDNDSKGKMHEVLVAAHLLTPGHTNHEDYHSLNFPSHFRTEEEDKSGKKRKAGETPQELHDRLRENLTPEQYQHHYEKAKFAAETIREHHDVKGRRIKNVYWTSNPKDISRLTGNEQESNPSDLVMEFHPDKKGRFLGKSLKVAKKSKSPTLANPGQKQIEDILGKKTNWQEEHNTYKRRSSRNMRQHGEQHGFHVDSSGTIIDKASRKKLSDKKIRDIEKLHPETESQNRAYARQSTIRIAKNLHQHFEGMHPHQIQNALRRLVQSTSDMRVNRVETSGEKGKFKTKIVNPHEEFENVMRYHGDHLHVRRSGNILHFKGKSGVTIASLQIKPKSGGGFTAPVGTLKGIASKAKTN